MREPNEENSGACFQREVDEMYGTNEAEPSPEKPSDVDEGSVLEIGDYSRSPEQEARDAGFDSQEEYEDYLEDLNES
ncbi:hypothetical protein [Polyangium fumosum]|uniref:Uncharacterized protein n=1 Tax=Polyangium fumosum TaxID=889272 RepID=A0A4U1IUJ2_9BACT|nr:hypothetical protein [Polyangium fumosum]TKC98029.1 hypothetical protein E8A74_42970 [Polyangium fumosum]